MTAGALGDRWPQHRVVAISLMVWSGATAMSGAATGFLFFLFTRSILTASAEAFYPPVSHAYLASWHGDATRATAISIHQVAQYAGPVASGFLAAYIAERFGWRTSFYGFGIVGCLMALIMLRRLRSPPVSVNAREPSDKLFAGFLICFQSRGVRRIGFAFAAVLFASVGFGTWVPTYLLREFDLSLTQAGFQAALWASLGAMVGAVSGGWLSDRLKVAGHSRFSLQSVALSLAGICLLSMGTAPSLSTAMAWLAGVGYFKGIYEGTLAVSLYDYVPAKFRSSAAAVVLLLANLLAAPSAAILGFASDHADLRWPLSSLALFLLIAAGLLWRSRSLPTIQETQEEQDVFRSTEK